MDLYESLLSIAKLLLADDEGEKTAELLFRRVLEVTGAERGFIVVREGNSYEQKFDVRFERAELTADDRKFSRGVVKLAIATRQLLHSANVLEDPRMGQFESVIALGRRSVLVAPLCHQDDVYGVIYLERPDIHHFPEDAIRFVADFAEVAGLFLKRVSDRQALEQRAKSLERDLFAKHEFEGIVTHDPKMLELLRVVAQVADSDASVLIRGETGTGKELVARALHVNSARRGKPFIALHCTALPGTVLESELFGHVKGAFTGADRDRAGRIASAHGGTLFLDEVAEVAPEVQAKLLRFLQFGEIQRLGSDRTEKVDVRILAATHRDLSELISAGKFRQDLYFRLNVVEVHIPALRDRRHDVPLLIEHYTRKHWRRAGETPRWTPRARQALGAYDYPGNVRELAHVVERACLLARGPDLDLDALPPEVRTAAPSPDSPGATPFAEFTSAELEAAREAAVQGVERAFLTGLLQKHEGNVSLAARSAGLHRSYLQKLLARNRIRDES